MTETSIIAIILSLVAVCGALGGTWLGRLLERNDETRTWRRERCLEAVVEVLNSCEFVVLEADIAYGMEKGTPEYNAQHEVVIRKVLEMHRTMNRAFLLGSQNLHDHIFAYTIHCGIEVAGKATMPSKISKKDWQKIRVEDLATLHLNCLNAARNELEIFPSRYRINGFELYETSINKIKEELSNGAINGRQAVECLDDLNTKFKAYKKEWKKMDKDVTKRE